MATHGLRQGSSTAEIHVPIEKRLLNRLPHRFQAGKVHHASDGLGWRREGPVQISCRANIPLHTMQTASGIGGRQFQNPIQGNRRTISEVIQHHKLMTCLKQDQQRVTANKASATGE